MNVTATAIALLEKDGKFLITKRNCQPFRGEWCIPGGHIDFGEDAIDGIKREVKEEVGLNFEPVFWRYYDEHMPERDKQHVMLVFYGKFSGAIKFCEDEVMEGDFYPIEDIKKMDFITIHQKVIEDYLEDKNGKKIKP